MTVADSLKKALVKLKEQEKDKPGVCECKWLKNVFQIMRLTGKMNLWCKSCTAWEYCGGGCINAVKGCLKVVADLGNKDYFISGSETDGGIKPGTTCKNSGCTTVSFSDLLVG